MGVLRHMNLQQPRKKKNAYNYWESFVKRGIYKDDEEQALWEIRLILKCILSIA